MKPYKNMSLKDIVQYVDGMGLMKEEWKAIPDWPYYNVSSFGRIKSLERTSLVDFNDKRGMYYQFRKEKILKQRKHKQGYLMTWLFKIENGKQIRKGVSVHRLVGLLFIKNPKNKKEINHKNGIKWDNRYWELEWATPTENIQHSFKIGTHVGLKDENHPLAKFSNKKVIKIIGMHKNGASISAVAKKLKVNYEVIWRIVNKISYKTAV